MRALLLLLLIMCSGCQTVRYVAVEVPPTLVEAYTVTGQEVAAEIERLFPDASIDVDRYEDGIYSIPTDESFWQLVEWAARERKRLGFKWVKNRGDCDNFARWMVFGADLSAMRSNLEGQVLVSRMNVRQLEMFGRVPSGGRHALNWARTDKALYAIEAQTIPEGGSTARVAVGPKGKLTLVDEYPNLEGLYHIKID